MEKIWVLCPVDSEQYHYFITEVTPKLDDAGLSFCVMRPSGDVAQMILGKTGREIS